MADAAPQPNTRHRPGKAFMKPVQPDSKLAAIIGDQPLPRTEITRKLWDYIRSHDLQDRENKTLIVPDAKLKEVLDGKDRVTMFEMTKLVSRHVH